MATLEALQVESAADVRDGKRTVTFTEEGKVCFDPGQGYEEPGVFCRVDTLPEPVRGKLEHGHRMACYAMTLLVEAMQEAQARGYGGPEDAIYAGR